MIAGAILTQAAAWRNVERALGNLLSAGIEDWPAVHALPQDDLADLVRPSGYYNAKARKLKAFAAHVCEEYDGDLDRMFAGDTETVRRELLGIHGIGPETADDILVYRGRQAVVRHRRLHHPYHAARRADPART